MSHTFFELSYEGRHPYIKDRISDQEYISYLEGTVLHLQSVITQMKEIASDKLHRDTMAQHAELGNILRTAMSAPSIE